MTQEKITPLRERMMEDMRIHGMGDKAQKAHIRAIKHFAGVVAWIGLRLIRKVSVSFRIL